MIAQFLVNSLLLWSQYGLLAAGFFLSSAASRHFNFASGLAFLVSPYVALALTYRSVPLVVASIVGVVAAGFMGFFHQIMNVALYSRGSRPGQLLLVSLSILALGQNALALLAGNASRALLEPKDPGPLQSGLTLANPDLVTIVAAFLSIAGLFLFLRLSGLGILVTALQGSRLTLAYLGWDVRRVERWISFLGFALSGLAGILTAIVLRIHPLMGFEMAMVGVVGYVVGPLLVDNFIGVLGATLLIVIVRLPLVLGLDGDWGMTPTILVLALALIVSSIRGKGIAVRQ